MVSESRIGIAITPFAGVVDLDRNAGQSLDHVLAGESGVPTGAAGGDVNFFQGAEFGFADVHFFQKNSPGVLGDAAERCFLDGVRLLVNLFEHEVLEAAFFGHDGIPGDALGCALHGMAVEIGDFDALLGDDGEVAVGEKEEIAGVIEESGNVAGHEVFVFAEADDYGRAVAGGDDFSWIVGGDNDEREDSRELFDGFADGLFE